MNKLVSAAISERAKAYEVNNKLMRRPDGYTELFKFGLMEGASIFEKFKEDIVASAVEKERQKYVETVGNLEMNLEACLMREESAGGKWNCVENGAYPSLEIEVIGYNKEWECKENPNGTKGCFMTATKNLNRYWIISKCWQYMNTYLADSSEAGVYNYSLPPTHWIEMPVNPNLV